MSKTIFTSAEKLFPSHKRESFKLLQYTSSLSADIQASSALCHGIWHEEARGFSEVM
jgi:hypothetical protein